VPGNPGVHICGQAGRALSGGQLMGTSPMSARSTRMFPAPGAPSGVVTRW